MSIAGADTDNEKAHKSSSIVRTVACGLCGEIKYAYGDYVATFYL
jgi:hypothetical protein